MYLEDDVWGSQEISEEVLVELMESRPMQRLKGISQAGPAPYFLDKPFVSRFQHSVGVMLLLRDFDAPIEEQVAGLLHDVPHTAFSHVADFVFDNTDHEYHERFMEDIVLDSEIPGILERHGIETGTILDDSNFGLLERDRPDLCADRIDYFLRDWKVVGGNDIEEFRESLEARQGLFVLDDPGVAEEYALAYIDADRSWWASPDEVALHHVFAEAIRAAIDSGVMEEEDLFGTDEEVLGALRESGNPEIRKKLELLENGFKVLRDVRDPDYIAGTKARWVDPLVVSEGELVRTSEISAEVREEIENHRKEVEGGYSLDLKKI